jgi:Transposase IS116/IS110/IS902 family
VTARAPGLLGLYGIGPETAALLLAAAGEHPERLRSEAAWAHLCGTAPIPASSGKRTRHRLNCGGDRQANHALWRIVITRMAPTRRPAPMSAGAAAKACRRRRSSATRSPRPSSPAGLACGGGDQGLQAQPERIGQGLEQRGDHLGLWLGQRLSGQRRAARYRLGRVPVTR